MKQGRKAQGLVQGLVTRLIHKADNDNNINYAHMYVQNQQVSAA